MFKQRPSIICLAAGVCFCCMTGCTFPAASGTHVTVAGQIFDPFGRPVPNQKLEVTLPAEYGLNEIDLSSGGPEEYHHQSQTAQLVTDALGSFSHAFRPVTYSTRFWVIPPLGKLGAEPPEPSLVIRLLDDPAEYYSVLVKKNDTVYAIHRPGELRQGGPLPKTVDIRGALHKDKRGQSRGWAAVLEIKRLVPPGDIPGAHQLGRPH